MLDTILQNFTREARPLMPKPPAVVFQHPSAPVTLRPHVCLGRCQPCDPRCTEPQTAERTAAAQAAQRAERVQIVLDLLQHDTPQANRVLGRLLLDWYGAERCAWWLAQAADLRGEA